MAPPKWDLDQFGLGSSEDILSSLNGMPARAEGFAKARAKGIVRLGPKGIRRLIEDRDALELEFEGAWLYGRLDANARTNDPVAGKLNNAANDSMAGVSQAYAPLDIALAKRVLAMPDLIQSKELARYRHYLERVHRGASHLLSEKEERLILEKDKTGMTEWSQLQRSWLSTRKFPVNIDGNEKLLSFGEVYGMLFGPRRDLRKQAAEVVSKRLQENEIVWSHALRSICADHFHTCELRGYSSPLDASYVYYDVTADSVRSMMGVIGKNLELNAGWLEKKTKLLGVDRMCSWDISALIPTKEEHDYEWEEAVRIVDSAYSQFDGQLGNWVREMFSSNRLDAEVREGKAAGAFSQDWLGGKSAFILMSHNRTLKDVYTLAHELGHSIHTYLYSRVQAPVNCRISYCIAECGSTFGELLLTDQLLAAAKSDEERRMVLAEVLTSFNNVVFQTTGRYRLETSLYDAVREGKYLDGEAISALWVEARDYVNGDAVEWLPESKWDWARVPHYFFSDTRYYNYPYAFAQLFTFALYRTYKEEGRGFVPKFKAMLAAGSSRSPEGLASDFGFDLGSEAFWEKGMEQAREFLAMLR